MQIGRLRHRVTIERIASIANGPLGEAVPTFEEFHECWAEVRPVSGREILEQAQVGSMTSHVVTTRAVPGLSAKMRVKFGTRLFAVESFREILERGEWAEFRCVEVG